MTAHRYLFAWELGAGYGHLAQIEAMAQALKAQGDGCAFAVRHLANAQQRLPANLGPCLQAPVRLGPGLNPVKTQLSYASLLHNIGFDDPLELRARIRAWRDLMRLLRTQTLIAVHSPIALVAARSLGLQTFAVGTGFTLPPATQPFPAYDDTQALKLGLLEDNEALVLAHLHEALAPLSELRLDSLAGIFADTPRALFSYPQLDHYPHAQRQEPYLGWPGNSFGIEPKWPAGGGPKLLAYLQPGPLLEPMLQALRASHARVLLRVEGAAPAQLQAAQRPGLTLLDQALNLQAAATECHAYIGTGAHGHSCEMMLAGRPGLLLPSTQERFMLSHRLETQGAALLLPPDQPQRAAECVDQLLEDDTLAQAAGQLLKSGTPDHRQAVTRAIQLLR